jgi:hypothetical protein
MLTSLVTGNTCYELRELAMLQSFKVDQAATFASVILLSVEPKLGFKSTEQERTGDGVPKWECQVVAGFRQFGRVVNEVIKVGVVSHTNPGDSVVPYTPVELVGFEVGVMPKEKKDRDTGTTQQIGISVWYRCDELRSTAATGNLRKVHPAEGA